MCCMRWRFPALTRRRACKLSQVPITIKRIVWYWVSFALLQRRSMTGAVQITADPLEGDLLLRRLNQFELPTLAPLGVCGATCVGYQESISYKDALVRKLLIPRCSFELSHRLPWGRGETARRRGPHVLRVG